MIVERYHGYAINRLRDGGYRVWDGKEVFQVFEEATGALACTYTVFYNPKRILRLEDKEAVIAALVAPALAGLRRKIDAGDLTDAAVHAEGLPRAAAAG